MRSPWYKWFLRLGFATKCGVLFLGMLAISCVMYVLSVATRQTRAWMLLTFAFGLFTLLALLVHAIRTRPRRGIAILVASIVLISAFAVHMTSPNGPRDAGNLRAEYLRSVHSFDGTVYIWGGESHLGVDCSGLVRTAMVEALMKHALRTGDRRLLLDACRFWWRDMTASAMHNHMYGYTQTIGHADELSKPETMHMARGFDLLPGDIAVTDSKAHVMVYSGNGEWTEGSPENLRVVTNKAAGSRRPYFRMPVTILRWWVFEE